jgi:murein DD-endopeptidase MepM/ murein hydrolase activator NlpD
LAILALLLLIGLVSRIAFTPISTAEPSHFASVSQHAAAEAVATPTLPAASSIARWQMANRVYRGVFRKAQHRTQIPERDRLNVITYTIQSGDTIFDIAERFELSPYTVVWSNMETLQGAPWHVKPGLTLYILPVDGAYHTVMEGETAETIAEDYDVASAALHNSWNDLKEGQMLQQGQFLVIPGGQGEDFDWEPPPPPPARPGVGTAAGSWGNCGDTAVSGPGALGSFILPTGSYAVSGWYFRDPRKPSHIGLDYKCYLGDPIYAADNGVVVFAGWSGGYGNLVRVRHGNGYETYYAHFDSFAVGCGQAVYQGQILGYCGSTGWSSGPHLHYEIRLNGVPQNPKLFE